MVSQAYVDHNMTQTLLSSVFVRLDHPTEKPFAMAGGILQNHLIYTNPIAQHSLSLNKAEGLRLSTHLHCTNRPEIPGLAIPRTIRMLA